MLQCVAVRCSALQCVAVCCSVLQCVADFAYVGVYALQYVTVCCSALQCVAVRCSALQCAAVCCSALQILPTCVCMRCSMLQCVAVRCSALQCVAVCCSALQMLQRTKGSWPHAYMICLHANNRSMQRHSRWHTCMHIITCDKTWISSRGNAHVTHAYHQNTRDMSQIDIK